MTQQLKPLTALAEDLSPFPSTHMAGSQLSVTPVLKDPKPFPGLCSHCTHVVHTHMCQQNTLR